ncbi:PQQ-dependent sugar dehydrogenase [Allorhodopirellula solitaria]|uniref:Soluble aldose sugar dehydrogenase YliI n=1 Tax=Allorhodopirellula solitaria TaxID=2527987 RepID=A0A5C5X1Q6_9BACT|nr:PQQ-dependent sugar dehydrogenase [Allorhodopirellula solitaria]TWT56162.1 Soluble aldose sugar dehydrogenase YliI precursor [Allorhodopirellula solitaria]
MPVSTRFTRVFCRRLAAACLVVSTTSALTTATAIAESPGSPTINLANPPADLNTDPLDIQVVEAYPNLRISRPIVMTGAGDGSGRLFVASQTGEIYYFDQDDEEVEEPELFMDLSDRVGYKDRENEEGFLGMAFHPEFAENGKLYIYYTTSQRPHVSILSEFQTKKDSDGKLGDPDSERELMRIDQPFWNHNGGTVAFGPDGYLYVGLGDGGKANDPLKSAQDFSKLLGSILRIDIDTQDGELPYGIPKDNPLVGRSHVWPEIYAWGIRNIWRMSFDPATDKLWAADVGQNDWEEVNLIRKGGNYGWSLREGANRFTLGGEKGSDVSDKYIEPLIEYPHTDDWGKSVTGGLVYRGKETPSLDGYYLYGDYVSGRLWAMKIDPESEEVLENRTIAWQQLPIFTFGETESGEALMSTMMGGGRIYKFVTGTAETAQQ